MSNIMKPMPAGIEDNTLSNFSEQDEVIYNRSKDEMFILQGAEHSRYNAWHWFRYLRKIIDRNGEIILDSLSIKSLLKSPRLTNFQKVVLKRAVEKGSPTYEYLRELNQPCKRKMLEEFFKRNPDAEKHRNDFLRIR